MVIYLIENKLSDEKYKLRTIRPHGIMGRLKKLEQDYEYSTLFPRGVK